MSRKQARNILFKMVFELCFIKPEESQAYEDFIESEQYQAMDKVNKDFVVDMYRGVIEHYDDINDIISKHIKGYTLQRLFKIDLAILQIATYELLYYKETPVSVVANEAVELSKKYSTEKSFSFINAVVGSIAKSIS